MADDMEAKGSDSAFDNLMGCLFWPLFVTLFIVAVAVIRPSLGGGFLLFIGTLMVVFLLFTICGDIAEGHRKRKVEDLRAEANAYSVPDVSRFKLLQAEIRQLVASCDRHESFRISQSIRKFLSNE